AGIASLQIAGTTLTLAQLQALAGTPVTIDSARGLLTLTGFDGATGEISYSYQVDGAQNHSAGDASVIDSFALLLTDANGQTASDSLDILITDTQPVLGTPASAVLNLEAGTTAIGDLNLEPIVDLDGASISFRGAVDASGYILSTTLNGDGTTSAAYLTYLGQKLTYVSNPDGSLTAVVAGTSTAVFTASADPQTGRYTIKLLKDLDPAITTAIQEDFTLSGGNQDSYTVSASLGQQFSLLANAKESDGSAATVNTSNFSFGVSDGQSIDQGEQLTFKFLDQSTNTAAGMSSVSLTALKLGAGESLNWKTFDASGNLIGTGSVSGTGGSNTSVNFSITDASARIASVTLTGDTASTSFKLELTAVSGQSSTHAQQIELYATAHDGDGDSSAEQSLSVTFEPEPTLTAGASGSALGGDSSDNLLTGSAQDDILIGGAGNDTLNGDGGNDILNGGAGNDSLDGGAGTDILDLSDASAGITLTLVQSSSNTTVNLGAVGLGTDTYRNIEGVQGSDFADTLTGSSGNDVLIGGQGNDTLIGSAGDDILIGGAGDDILTGGDGADTFVWRAGDTGNDVVTDFDPGEGDTLDLSDLLQGAGESNILEFLQLDQGTSTLRISTTGEFDTGGTADATIQLQDGAGGALDLSAYGSTANDIITELVKQSVAKVENT
ncbi:calcium-binding protein, partial [Azotobacter chroococcum]